MPGLPDLDRRFIDLKVTRRDDVVGKRSTAMSPLVDVADGLDRAAPWPDCRVVAAYVFGPVLDTGGDVERVRLAFVVDEPADDVSWLSRPARLEASAALLRFDKLPRAWWWRPVEWPVWNAAVEPPEADRLDRLGEELKRAVAHLARRDDLGRTSQGE